MPATWEDITSYDRRRPEKAEPTAFEMNLTPTFRIAVVRDHIRYPKGTWILSCHDAYQLDGTMLGATTADAAKAEALELVARYVRKICDALYDLGIHAPEEP